LLGSDVGAKISLSDLLVGLISDLGGADGSVEGFVIVDSMASGILWKRVDGMYDPLRMVNGRLVGLKHVFIYVSSLPVFININTLDINYIPSFM